MKCLTALLFMTRQSGVWPSHNYIDKYYLHKVYLRLIAMSYFSVGLVLYPIELLHDPKSEFVDFIDAGFTIVCLINLWFNYIVTFVIRRSAMNHLEKLTNFEKFGEPPNMSQTNKTLNHINIIIFGYMSIGCGIVQISELILLPSCQDKYHRIDREVLCGFVTKLYYPYNIKNGILWYLHIALADYCLYIIIIGGGAFSCGLITSVGLVVARFDHLKIMIHATFNCRTHFEKRLKFRRCCMYHQHIISLVDEINEVYFMLTTPALIIYSIMIGLQLLCLSMGFSLKALINLIGWIAAIFMMCVYSDRLAEKSLSVGSAVYDARWYEADVKLRRDILFMMMRSQRASYIKSGSLGFLSHESFKMIIKGSYTYATMRRM